MLAERFLSALERDIWVVLYCTLIEPRGRPAIPRIEDDYEEDLVRIHMSALDRPKNIVYLRGQQSV